MHRKLSYKNEKKKKLKKRSTSIMVFAHIVLWKPTSDQKEKNFFSRGQVLILGNYLLQFIWLSQHLAQQCYVKFSWTLFWLLYVDWWKLAHKGYCIHPLNPVTITRVPNEPYFAVSWTDYPSQLSLTKIFSQEAENLFKIKA